MMMSKPSTETTAPTAAATATTAEPAAKPAGAGTVADLERRLASLSTTPQEPEAAPAFAVPAVQQTQSTDSGSNSSVKGGKNALLARIMAAQERAKQAQTPAPEPAAAAAPVDLLSGDAPAAAPPPFDASFLPPQEQKPPPPIFDDFLVPPAAAAPPAMSWDPLAPTAPVSTPSAPDFGDLLAHEAPVPPMAPPPPMMAPTKTPEEEAIEAIMSIEGLSDEEKQAMIAEQRQILEQMKPPTPQSAAQSAADAFESRSFQANVQSIGGNRQAVIHGPERTRQAIQRGEAKKLQCISCQHWMQVTPEAEFMNCPVCSTVQKIGIKEDEAQMDADLKLAEQLQKEEYQAAEQEERQQRQQQQQRSSAAQSSSDGGWMEWLGLSGTASASDTAPERPAYTAPGSVSVTTGTERRPTSNNTRSATVAAPQPMFACVTDSISTALTQVAAPPPENVDSSSLLAMPNVDRTDSRDRSGGGGGW